MSISKFRVGCGCGSTFTLIFGAGKTLWDDPRGWVSAWLLQPHPWSVCCQARFHAHPTLRPFSFSLRSNDTKCLSILNAVSQEGQNPIKSTFELNESELECHFNYINLVFRSRHWKTEYHFESSPPFIAILPENEVEIHLDYRSWAFEKPTSTDGGQGIE